MKLTQMLVLLELSILFKICLQNSKMFFERVVNMWNSLWISEEREPLTNADKLRIRKRHSSLLTSF